MQQFSSKKKLTDHNGGMSGKNDDNIIIVDPTTKQRYQRLKFLGKVILHKKTK